jgi:hypothetical protein
MKVCKKCNIEKELNLFYKLKGGKFGVDSCCKDCRCKEGKEKYNIIDKNKIKEKNKDKWVKNKDKIKESNNIKSKEYYHKNKDIINKKNQDINVKERKKRYLKTYLKEKRKNDGVFRLIQSYRSRIYEIVKEKNLTKDETSIKWLGVNVDTFKNHIESQWVEGMSWDNYGNKKGQWSLDHIIPISSATNIDEVKKLNYYSNFQPLWWDENIKKSNKIIKN